MGELPHRYAVILAADVAHFGGLMESDSEATVRALQGCRADFRRCVSTFHGREFGSDGDCFIAEFNSPVEALRAARDYQQRFAGVEPIAETGEKPAPRIGLHAGNVICNGDDPTSDIVDIAEYLREIARPGEIVLSDFVYRQVRKERGFAFRSLGKHRLKNIFEPVLVYRVNDQRKFSLRRVAIAAGKYKPAIAATLGVIVAGALFAWYLATRDQPGIADTTIPVSAENTIAVLPFDVCDGHEDDESVAGGLTAAVHNRLAQRRPKVVAKSQASVRTVTETAPSISETSRLLGVENLLHGELCRDQSDRLTIKVELLDADGFTKWQQDYRQIVDRQDQVEVQLATLIENGVATELGDKSESEPDVAVDHRALEFLLIAQDHRREDRLDEARAALAQALQIEPDYTEAHFELALLTNNSSINRMVGDARGEAIEIAEKALALARASVRRNPGDFRANWVAGRILFAMAGWENNLLSLDSGASREDEAARRKALARTRYVEAEGYLSTALSLNPSDSDVRSWLVRTLDRLGMNSRNWSLELLREGLELDPYNASLTRLVALRLTELGRLRDAMDLIDQFDRLPQGKGPGLGMWQLEILNNYGRYDRKLFYLIEALEDQPDTANGLMMIAHLYWLVSQLAHLGLYDEAAHLYATVAEVPWDRDPEVKQLFLDDFYGFATGRSAEVAERRLQHIAGQDNEEILAAWYPYVVNNIWSFWVAGDRQRAIELMEATYHHPGDPTNWSERQMNHAAALARFYMRSERGAAAAELWREVATHLQTEVDSGVKHPHSLHLLAIAYGWLGETDKAFDVLDMAVDSGASDMMLCCEDYLAPESIEDGYEFGGGPWWQGHEDHPDFKLIRIRMRSDVDGQRATIRALLEQNDMEELIGNLIEVRESLPDREIPPL